MTYEIFATRQESGAAAARRGAEKLRAAIAARGQATIIVATGASQFEMLEALVKAPDIDWHRVTMFHLDEYVGIPISHPASFRKYLWERFVRRLPVPPRAFHYLDAEGDVENEISRKNAEIAKHSVDVAFIGIGENGHLAFNDPPADFQTDKPYLLVKLDDACRRQQVGEGWFKGLSEVPTHAISMSVKQILKSAAIICTVPDLRKARAVADAIEGPVTPDVPASILQKHSDAVIFLDAPAASMLRKKPG
jgi:glucosamine-6-phosphate deaminase